jgi:MFS family permease
VVLLWGTAACSALAALATATLPAGVGAAVTTGRTGVRGALGDLAEGVCVLRRDALLGTVTALSVFGMAVLAALQMLVLPVHLVAERAPGVLGLVVTFLALGGIGGAALYAAVGPRIARRRVFVLAQLTTAAGIVGLAALPPPPLLLAAAALAGLGSGPVSALVVVLVAERIPDAVRGCVLGLQNAAALAATPAGLLGAGLLVESIGLRPTGMLVAGAWVLLAATALVAPALRKLEVANAHDR